jgi:hypothetical protein
MRAAARATRATRATLVVRGKPLPRLPRRRPSRQRVISRVIWSGDFTAGPQPAAAGAATGLTPRFVFGDSADPAGAVRRGTAAWLRFTVRATDAAGNTSNDDIEERVNL